MSHIPSLPPPHSGSTRAACCQIKKGQRNTAIRIRKVNREQFINSLCTCRGLEVGDN